MQPKFKPQAKTVTLIENSRETVSKKQYRSVEHKSQNILISKPHLIFKECFSHTIMITIIIFIILQVIKWFWKYYQEWKKLLVICDFFIFQHHFFKSFYQIIKIDLIEISFMAHFIVFSKLFRILEKQFIIWINY